MIGMNYTLFVALFFYALLASYGLNINIVTRMPFLLYGLTLKAFFKKILRLLRSLKIIYGISLERNLSTS